MLTLPRDKPLAHVSVKPVPGWTAKIVEAALPTPVTVQGTTLTKAARTITWTATPGAAIGPGQYQEFSISAGPLPAPGAFVLSVAQRYSDGKVVSWDQPQTKGAPEIRTALLSTGRSNWAGIGRPADPLSRRGSCHKKPRAT